MQLVSKKPWPGVIRYGLVGLVLFSVSGCSSSAPVPDDLVGTYTANPRAGSSAAEADDALVEVAKIEKQGTSYIFYEKHRDEWRKSKQPMTPVSTETFAKVLGHKVEVPFTGLATKGVAVFKVPAGWHSSGFTTSTGYFMKIALRPVELHKQ